MHGIRAQSFHFFLIIIISCGRFIYGGIIPGPTNLFPQIETTKTHTGILGPDGKTGIVALHPDGEINNQKIPAVFEPAGKMLAPIAPIINPLQENPFSYGKPMTKIIHEEEITDKSLAAK